MKLKNTVEEVKGLNYLAAKAIRNVQNYESVAKYFDFQKAVRAVFWNQN